MPIFIKKNTKLYFIHIPRTAGRFVTSMFIANNYDAHCYTSNVKSCPAEIEPMHLHYPLYNRYLNVGDLEHFTVVRNPVDKIWSAISVIHGLHNPKNFIKNLENKDWFISFIDRQRSFSSYRNNWFMPQQNFISHKTKIYKYEDGIENLIPWINYNFKTKLEYKNDYDNSYLSEIEISGNNKKELMTDKIKNNIIEYYVDDFKKFNY